MKYPIKPFIPCQERKLFEWLMGSLGGDGWASEADVFSLLTRRCHRRRRPQCIKAFRRQHRHGSSGQAAFSELTRAKNPSTKRARSSPPRIWFHGMRRKKCWKTSGWRSEKWRDYDCGQDFATKKYYINRIHRYLYFFHYLSRFLFLPSFRFERSPTRNLALNMR